MGFEPTTPGTTIRCSAVELPPPQFIYLLSVTEPQMARQKGFRLTRSRRLLLYLHRLLALKRILVAAQDLNPGPADYDSDALTS